VQPSFALASSGKETAITAVRIIAAAGLLSHLRFSSALGRSHRLSPRAKLCAVSTVPYRRPAVTSAPPGAPPPRLARPFTASVQCAQPPSGLAPHPKHLCAAKCATQPAGEESGAPGPSASLPQTLPAMPGC
jgi:hypothetical protein